jgi:hypothetical protein
MLERETTEMRRRDLLKAAVLLPALAQGNIATGIAQDCNCAFTPPVGDRLDQGPFDIDQDQGWQTVLFTTPSERPLRNPGLGLVGYAWEEGGPSLAARAGRESLERHVEKISSLPFVDVLYIRCDWRNVQSRTGRLDLDPVWALTLDAAKRKGLRVAFRVQLSNESFQPEQVALPPFIRDRVPLVAIGRIPGKGNAEYREPRYDHPEFQKAFAELNDLLAAEFEGNPLIEWMDLMQYGFWGEGHTSNYPNPFPDFATARSDSIIVEEPVQIDELANRPPWIAAIMEDGYLRQYDTQKLKLDAVGINELENYMLHVPDLRANYWGLWTEADSLAHYNEMFPRGFDRLRTSIGYRLRPSWVWQRKRYGAFELIVCVSNSGTAGVPGVLWLNLESPDKKLSLRGALDSGHPHGGGLRQASFLLPKDCNGKVLLSAELEIRPGMKKPIAWACEQPVNADGSVTVELKSENDRGWRKGV